MNTVNQSAIKHKIGLLNLAQELGNVSKACKMMGFSRDTFLPLPARQGRRWCGCAMIWKASKSD
jgi:hypothetical protein